MRVLIYEDGLDGTSLCVYETNAKNVKKYAVEAYHGEHVDDIVFDSDDFEYYELFLTEKTIHPEGGEIIRFDVAINANDLDL